MIKLFLTTWIFTTLCFNAAFANPNPLKTRRTIHLEINDPRSSFDANIAVWQTTNDVVALGSDYLNSTTSSNRLWARAGIFVGGLYLSSMLRYYSHEAAHEYAYRQNNLSVDNSINWRKWKSSYIPGIYYPSWEQKSLDPGSLSEAELLASITAGLNQDELNAAAAWRSMMLRGQYSFYDAQSFLLTSLRDVDYIARSRSDQTPFAPGMPLHQLQNAIFNAHPHLYDDVNLYRLILWNNSAKISNEQMLNRGLFASAMSWHTWESLFAMISYLAHGRNATPVAIKLGAQTRISPPLFSHYWGADGSFMNSAFIVTISETRMQFEIGSKLGYSKWNAFQDWRVGIKLQNIVPARYLSIQPFLYVNADDSRNLSISSAGLEGYVFLSGSIGVWFRIQTNNHDILENEIKGLKPGIQTTFGLSAQI